MGMLEMKSMILKMKHFLHRLNSNLDKKEKNDQCISGQGKTKYAKRTTKTKQQGRQKQVNKQKCSGPVR